MIGILPFTPNMFMSWTDGSKFLVEVISKFDPSVLLEFPDMYARLVTIHEVIDIMLDTFEVTPSITFYLSIDPTWAATIDESCPRANWYLID